jgi:hypothetical protein
MSLDPLTAALGLGGKLIDKIFPDPQARAAAQLELMKLAQNGELAQLTAETELAKAQAEINQAEASSTSLFVSGWRPFVGWVCGLGLAVQFLVAPLVGFLASLAGRQFLIPTLDMSVLLTLLFGMLGLGGMRTFEKMKGVARS